MIQLMKRFTDSIWNITTLSAPQENGDIKAVLQTPSRTLVMEVTFSGVSDQILVRAIYGDVFNEYPAFDRSVYITDHFEKLGIDEYTIDLGDA